VRFIARDIADTRVFAFEWRLRSRRSIEDHGRRADRFFPFARPFTILAFFCLGAICSLSSNESAYGTGGNSTALKQIMTAKIRMKEMEWARERRVSKSCFAGVVQLELVSLICIHAMRCLVPIGAKLS